MRLERLRRLRCPAPWLAALKHRPTTLAVAAERGALTALEGSCKTAIGAYARLDGERLTLIVEALTPDGARRIYRLDPRGVGAMRDWLDAHWSDALNAFKDFADLQEDER